jgi:superfamily II DNA or RNA helicase/tellurite resistance protein
MHAEHLQSPDVLREDADSVRGRIFEFGGGQADVGAPHPHQNVALRRIESVAQFPRSGIVHFPTGAGKTRVGIEVIARALRSNSAHRFLWTHSKTLITQSMVRLAEMSGGFAPGTRFTWIETASDLESVHYPTVHVTFLTRPSLSNALRNAAAKPAHPWRRQLSQGRPLTLIYDECHQLGAEELQHALEEFYSAIGDPGPSCPWRVIGLSATPIPSSEAAHRLLKRRVFPKVEPTTCFDWPFYVYSRVSNDTLVEDGILCRITDFFDRHGGLDLPGEVLKAAIKTSGLPEPGPGADPLALQRYASQFNRNVLSNPDALRYLARSIGDNIEVLKKTIVFVPTIAAANELVANLFNMFPHLRGFVSAVHSHVKDLPLQQVERGSVEAVLERFRALGDRPSVLVNVDMLTEGFDDPKIQTVVLARLTLSTNRFWQMIGRGTRGPKVGGTNFCYVVDPIKLTRVYDYFKGYQPSFDGQEPVEFEEHEPGDDDQGKEPPGGNVTVPGCTLPPDPRESPYAVDPRLAQVNAVAARAIEQFLQGMPLAEADALAVARTSRLEVRAGRVAFVPSATDFDSTAAAALLVGELSSLEARQQVSLPWLRQMLTEPGTVNDFLRWLRMLRAVEVHRCWTKPRFDAAGLASASVGSTEAATGQPEASVGDAPAAPEDDGGEAFVVDAGIAVAMADGEVTDAEVRAIADGLQDLFGRSTSPEVLERIRAHREAKDVARQVPARIPSPERVLRMLEGVAAADGVVSAPERELLGRLAKALGLPESFVEVEIGRVVVIGASTASATTTTPVGKVCRNSDCAFQAPAHHEFCTNCGRPLEPAKAAASRFPAATPSSQDDVPLCRESRCMYRSLSGNYGFCGRHRPPERRAARGSDRCRGYTQDGRRCTASALPGNYGFCGRHR